MANSYFRQRKLLFAILLQNTSGKSGVCRHPVFAHNTTAKIKTFPELMMESVRTGLRQIMQDLLRARPPEEAVLLAWPLVCGKEVAARTTAAAFSDGTLTVEVSDVSWRNQLQSFAPRYLSGYEGLLGQVVKSVQFKVKHSAMGNQQSANK